MISGGIMCLIRLQSGRMLSSTLDFAKGLPELNNFRFGDPKKGLNLGFSDAWSLRSFI